MALTLCLFVAFAAAPIISTADGDQAKSSKPANPLTFNSPNVDSPSTRVSGATRGKNPVAWPEVLVPETAGYTLSDQPVLYWHLSAKTDERIEFTLIGLDPILPILEATLQGPFEAGIHRIRVADHGVKLETGVSYQWFVKVVPNPEQRLYDRVVGGGIDRKELTAELKAKLDAVQAGSSHYVLAAEGIWYDALDHLETQIATSPTDPALLSDRSSMLEQVGLEHLN
jgi:hypothetical protein